MEIVESFGLSAETLGSFFYIVSPNKTTFENIEDVPNYYVEAIPWMVIFFIVERLYLWKEKKISKFNDLRLNDAIGSGSLGMMDQITRLLSEGWRYTVYAYIYTNWRIATLPWDSLWTWLIAFFAADFLYYWTHRASHGHQLHHSSEDYNVSTSLRQSILVTHFVWVLYLPAALIVPPAAILVHYQLNFLYQFWIHTEVIKTLGPLEYILNTASHHRVHHGRNRYCIDKNYAGVLIIWDKMFGTFEAEKDEVVYGLSSPVNTFEPVTNQFRYFLSLLRATWSTEDWRNKLSMLFKGPGWSPGKPRLGNIEDIPEVEIPIQKYDPHIPPWCQLYCFMHAFIVVFLYMLLHKIQPATPPEVVSGVVFYLVLTLSSLGTILDGKNPYRVVHSHFTSGVHSVEASEALLQSYAILVESFRCFLYILVDYYLSPWIVLPASVPIPVDILILATRGLYLISGIIWMSVLFNIFKIAWNSK